ncbi:hypothetical protein MIMGU_mgv1a015965mg [Erythranthe guttata]|uniref:Uncharacterized protein n=1 Tax=Erythranthe guttata TaxID=4155 RepID=A0A022RYN3_ERYGU|nr:hypothetical protein MIMGU_mgv1a015965mg [Erythranthe guttata]
MAAPPTLNKQLGINIDFLFPKYQFWVMFSILTTTAYVFRWTWSMSLAKSTAITPALHPIPPKLKLRIFPLNLYLLTIMAESEGVGLNKLQLTTRMPICFGLTFVLRNKLSSAPNITCSASSRAACIDGRGGMKCMASGT